jgi:hypothetical protein
MRKWLGKWFQRRTPEVRPHVSVTDWGVRCTGPDGSVESVAWDDLQAVEVHTTDCGPFAEDVFFVMIGASNTCVIPQSAQNVDELVTKLGELPGFDFGQGIKAMSSAVNARFSCWRRHQAEQGAAADRGNGD